METSAIATVISNTNIKINIIDFRLIGGQPAKILSFTNYHVICKHCHNIQLQAVQLHLICNKKTLMQK